MFKMKRNSFIYIVATAVWILSMMAGCSVSERTTAEVYPLDSTQSVSSGDGFIYGLAETRLTFHIKAVRKERIPGPYHEYGERLLGLSGIPHNREVTWDIANIRVRSRQQIDYDHLYRVDPRGRFALNWEKFTRDGWIVPLDTPSPEKNKTNFFKEPGPPKEVLYEDLSPRRFVGQETKTVYERVWRDSIYARVPREKTETVQKTREEKAREAAGFVFMIREKRFELIAGMGDYYPQGSALQAAIDEMARLEENYLALFKGKTFTDTIEYTLQMKPNQVNLQEPEMLFRFSSSKGIMPAGSDEGAPVWLEVRLQEDPSKASKALRNQTQTGDSSMFYYRLPVESLVTLKYGDQTIARKYLDVGQYGPILKMPLEFLNRSGFISYPPQEF
jgi:hypothetical protein